MKEFVRAEDVEDHEAVLLGKEHSRQKVAGLSRNKTQKQKEATIFGKEEYFSDEDLAEFPIHVLKAI